MLALNRDYLTKVHALKLHFYVTDYPVQRINCNKIVKAL